MDVGAGDGEAVRNALREELERRGYSVAADTVSLRGDLHVLSEGDGAAAILEIKATATEAAESMYQGHWMPDLPPRFAVLPVTERERPEVDLLQDAGLNTLFYTVTNRRVILVDLDAAVAAFKRPAMLAPSEQVNPGGSHG